jgi:hypothetical protein
VIGVDHGVIQGVVVVGFVFEELPVLNGDVWVDMCDVFWFAREGSPSPTVKGIGLNTSLAMDTLWEASFYNAC